MNKKLSSLLTFAALTAGSSAYGQGLLSIRPDRDEFEKRMPFTITLDAGGGYDSNVNLTHENEHGSAYASAGVGLQYQKTNRRTSWGFNLGYTGFYYFDAPDGVDDYMQSARLGANFSHRVNERLAIYDSFYLAYEFEPNYAIGAGTTRRTDQYLYGYNDLSVSYAWSRKFSTVTGYTITGTDYQEERYEGESYLSHIFHNEFRYILNPTTTAALSYRFAYTTYDNGFADYMSHYILTGLDHKFSPRSSGSFRVGAEIRDRDNGGTDAAPYFEGSYSYLASKDTTLTWYGRFGFEDSGVGSFTDRYSFRTGVSATQRFTSRLAGQAGLHYIHDEFDDSVTAGTNGFADDIFAFSIGLNYSLFRNISLNTSYSFSINTSEEEYREYNRHNVYLGLRATF
ncbi:MAG: outer membrane beta-barrel protein [Verrucomicrobiales bacterium]|nr:outer membrane beta-barrel protein [Verrucomicrobiales bacterium]